MQRLEEMYGESQEFSQQRLIDEDATMKEELKMMRNGLIRRRSTSSTITRNSQSSDSTNSSRLPAAKRHRSCGESSKSTMMVGSFFQKSGGSLSIALQASRKLKRKSSFLGGCKDGDDTQLEGGTGIRSAAFSHGAFISQTATTSRNYFGSSSNPSTSNVTASGKQGPQNASLFSRVAAGRG